MKSKEIKILVTQAEIILEQAKKFQGQGGKVAKLQGDVAYTYFIRHVELLIEQFNKMVPKINKLIEKEGIEEKLEEISRIEEGDNKQLLKKIREDKIIFNTDGKILELLFGASNALSFLREGVVLSETTQNKLDSLREELESLKSSLKEEVYTNLKEANESFERGCFLGSSLISGRIIWNCLDCIKGKDINEKIDSLIDNELISEKGGRDSILKSNHFGRNLTSHDLKIMPSSSEAISFLGDAIKIAKISRDYENQESQKEKLEPKGLSE